MTKTVSSFGAQYAALRTLWHSMDYGPQFPVIGSQAQWPSHRQSTMNYLALVLGLLQGILFELYHSLSLKSLPLTPSFLTCSFFFQGKIRDCSCCVAVGGRRRGRAVRGQVPAQATPRTQCAPHHPARGRRAVLAAARAAHRAPQGALRDAFGNDSLTATVRHFTVTF